MARSSHLAELARPFVDRARLDYRDFRVEFEAIGSEVVRAAADGVLDKDSARSIWIDTGHVLSKPLIARYCDARRHGAVAAWLSTRPSFSLTGWFGGHATFALDRFVADGEGARAASLALAHGERVMKALRLDWKERGRKTPKGLSPEAVEAFEAGRATVIARIPARNTEVLLEIAEAERYLAHGSDAERAAPEGFRAEVIAHRERFRAA